MKRLRSVLIVDDERPTREGLARALAGDYRVRLAESGEQALAMLAEEPADVVLTDLRMPGMDGLTLLRRILARQPQPVVILLTAYGSIETAVEAVKAGAYDFLQKPVSLDRLEVLLKRAIETRDMRTENRRLKEQLDVRFGIEHIVGQSAAMLEVLQTVRQVAPTRTTVLIQGESGTGKEMIAHAIHGLSPRRDGPFVAVHCAALAPTLLESELFGHERGAFTGATERRIGRFEIADGGTLFLDEIGEISPAIQVKILRVIEEHRFERVGGSMPIDVDVRLVTATNRDLKRMVDQGAFREDLFFRLNVVSIRLPPLRERREDIPLLAAHFVEELAAQNGRSPPKLSPAVLDVFNVYSWPGNVRELRNVLERMIVLARGEVLDLGDLPPELRAVAPVAMASSPAAPRLEGLTLAEAERRLIEQALTATGGNRAEAARRLGISRRTIHRKIEEYGLNIPPGRGEPLPAEERLAPARRADSSDAGSRSAPKGD
ncbi:MAG: sigma-54 dependent transcriptional regulator [Kiritimatiellae bacterium]|nr:sigma-54 dependent transcriptional regulator [Kiritimatiellia bacterium]